MQLAIEGRMRMRVMIHLLIASSALVLATPGYASAAPSPTSESAETEPVLPSYVDVDVDPEMIDAEYARAWASLGVSRALQRQPLDAERMGDRRLTVELSGSVGAYRIGVGVTGSADREAYSGQRDCACSDEEMIETVAEMVTEMSTRIDEEGEDVTPQVPPPRPGARTASDRRAPLAAIGRAGIGLTVGGELVAGTGIAFLVVGKDPGEGFADDRRSGRDFTRPGVAVASVGGAVLVAGIAMIVVDRVRARRTRSQSSASSRSPRGGVGFGARF